MISFIRICFAHKQFFASFSAFCSHSFLAGASRWKCTKLNHFSLKNWVWNEVISRQSSEKQKKKAAAVRLSIYLSIFWPFFLPLLLVPLGASFKGGFVLIWENLLSLVVLRKTTRRRFRVLKNLISNGKMRMNRGHVAVEIFSLSEIYSFRGRIHALFALPFVLYLAKRNNIYPPSRSNTTFFCQKSPPQRVSRTWTICKFSAFRFFLSSHTRRKVYLDVVRLFLFSLCFRRKIKNDAARFCLSWQTMF